MTAGGGDRPGGRRRLRRRKVAACRFAATDLPPPPEPVDPDIGFVVASPEASWDLVGVADQVRALADDVPTAEARAEHDKPYLLDLQLDVLPADSPLARLALNPAVVATFAAHLGMVPLLAGVTVLRSPYVAEPPSGSQLFHSDWDDVSQPKLLVHRSDVTPETARSPPFVPHHALLAPPDHGAKRPQRHIGHAATSDLDGVTRSEGHVATGSSESREMSAVPSSKRTRHLKQRWNFEPGHRLSEGLRRCSGEHGQRSRKVRKLVAQDACPLGKEPGERTEQIGSIPSAFYCHR